MNVYVMSAFSVNRSGPVSYTHLDVYKRQADARAVRDDLRRLGDDVGVERDLALGVGLPHVDVYKRQVLFRNRRKPF